MAKYEDLLSETLERYNKEELIQICKSLNKTYNVYDSEDYRWEQIRYVLTKTTDEQINLLRSTQLSNKVVNDLLMRFYPCERVIKYFLIKHLMPLCNHIVAFEMCIGNSRIDVCRINGGSYAYEIKTEYDSFERLETQMHDYIDAFEKVYLVVPATTKEQALMSIPPSCGLITYREKNGEMIFCYKKKASLNECCVNKCAGSLSSNDLTILLRMLGTKKIPSLKEEKLNLVMDVNPARFKSAYKELLKEKYQSKWSFLVHHFNDILPIDMQNFFSTSLDPNLTYSKNEAEP